MKEKIAFLLTPAVFLLLLFGLAIGQFLLPDRVFSENENRFLQQAPEFSLDALFDGSYTSKTETYMTDQFPGRDGFIGVKTATEFLVGKRDTNNVYFGRDGYLIEKHTDLAEQAEKNTARMAEFVGRAAEELGTSHVRVLIAPTAGEVLKSKLPAFAKEFSQEEFFASIRAAIPQACWVELLPLFQAHAEEYIYYKTDHHWTTDGAYLAYLAYCESTGTAGYTDFTTETVTEDFYGTIYSKARLLTTKPDSIRAYFPKDDFSYHLEFELGQSQSDSLYNEKYLEKKDKYSYFLNSTHAVTKITGPQKNGKTLFVIKDSYSHCMAPFLANDYETVFLVDLRYYNGSLAQLMEEQGATDVLVLYNAVTFSSDSSVMKITR